MSILLNRGQIKIKDKNNIYHSLDIIADNTLEEISAAVNSYNQIMPDLVNNWLVEHPESTTTVQNQSITKEKFASEVLNSSITNDICILTNPIVVDNLINKTADEIYSLFDAYVQKNILTKTTIGYGSLDATSSSTYSEEEAVPDNTLPIYLYSYRSPAANVRGSQNRTMLISANIHGNEPTGIPVMLNLLNCIERGDDKYVNNIISRFNIDFLPVVNPWGVNHSNNDLSTIQAARSEINNLNESITNLTNQINSLEDGTEKDTLIQQRAQLIEDRYTQYLIAFAGRTNARGVDLNRNGDFCWQSMATNAKKSSYKGPSPASEQETKVLMNLLNDSKYYLYIETHGLLDNLIFQTQSTSNVYQQFGLETVNKFVDRLKNFYNVDFDNYHMQENGAYRNAASSFGGASFPINAWAHKQQSPHRAVIIEMQRYNSSEMHPSDVQAYTSEMAITLISKITEYAEHKLVDSTVATSKTGAERENLLPQDSTKWINAARDLNFTFIPGARTRACLINPISVKAGETYEFGVASSTNDYYTNLQFVSSVSTEESKTFTFKQGNRLFRPKTDGYIFIIIARGENKTSFIDTLSIGKTIIPYLRKVGNIAALTVSGLETSNHPTVTPSSLYISGSLAFINLLITIKPDTIQSGMARYRIGNLSPAPCVSTIIGRGNRQEENLYNPVDFAWSTGGGFFIFANDENFKNGSLTTICSITYPILINDPDIAISNDEIYEEDVEDGDDKNN